jgi:uncharacterized membrane protein YhfC
MSTGAMAAMVFTMAVSVGLPIALMVLWVKPRGGRWRTFLVGGGTFVLFALVLEQCLHALVLQSSVGKTLQGNIWLYGLYGGLAAGLFEETGRLVAFKTALRRHQEPVTALAYGVGHGGTEAILLVGVTMVFNLVVLALSAGGALPASLQPTLDRLLATPASDFLLSALERVSAIALHVSLSVLVFAAANGRAGLYPAAIALHGVGDCLAVVAAAYLPAPVVELLVLVFVAAVALAAWRVYKNLPKNTKIS